MASSGVVIAGGGLAGQRCVERLRRRGYDGSIRMVCGEVEVPYDRPPLSKQFLAGEPLRVQFREREWYEQNDVSLLLGEWAARLDPSTRGLTLRSGERLQYDELLIATGAMPHVLPAAESFSNSFTLRTIADARAMREALAPGVRLAIIGAGFIGLEVAATARRLGVTVTIVEAADLPLTGVIGPQLGRWFADFHSDEGVSLSLGSRVAEFRGNGRVEELVLDRGQVIACDVLVVAIGVAPSLDWLTGSGLQTSGVLVDGAGRTSLPHVYAAGDAARGFEPALGRHVPSEHWEAAAAQGAAAADAMLGLRTAPRGPASFWSDQYGVRIHYLGHARLADSVSIDGCPAERDFTAVFTRRGQPVAALLAGRSRALPQMRQLISKGHPHELPS